MHTKDAHNLFIRFYSQNTYKIFVQIAFKFILLYTQQEDFAQFARNFRATIKNNMQLTYYMVARKFRASCVKSSCRVAHEDFVCIL